MQTTAKKSQEQKSTESGRKTFQARPPERGLRRGASGKAPKGGLPMKPPVLGMQVQVWGWLPRDKGLSTACSPLLTPPRLQPTGCALNLVWGRQRSPVEAAR